MHITRVTITGADDHTPIEALYTLSAKYPFVEWGILWSRSAAGQPRFPSHTWQAQLCPTGQSAPGLNLSLHLCGSWLKDLLKGQGTLFLEGWSPLRHACQRIQLNTNGEALAIYEEPLRRALVPFCQKELIVPYDGVNHDTLLRILQTEHLTTAVLFDTSGGAGIIPETWPPPLPGFSCGYAGGLGPKTLQAELARIAPLVQEMPIWIDMETHVRTDDNRHLDLNKVEACLDLVAPWVSATDPTPEMTIER